MSWKIATAASAFGVAVFLIDRVFKTAAVEGRFFLSGEAAVNPNILFLIPPQAFPLYLLVLVAAAWAVLLFVFAFRSRSDAFFSAGILFASGAASNLYDRFAVGGVIDWIPIRGFTVFNIADILILSSAFIVAAALFRQRERCHPCS